MIRYLLVGVRRAGMLGLALAMPAAARAGVIMTVEAPGVQYSQQANAVVETFDDPMLLGPHTALASAIGNYTASPNGAVVVVGDNFGGSNQTQYIAIGAQSGQTDLTLTFNTAQSYFGFYFAAIDGQNLVQAFDESNNLVQTVNDSTVYPLLMNDPAYFGNPNLPGVNTGEAYVFVNLFGTMGTKFSKIVFSNMGTGTGLESDSHTIVSAVPEPSSLVAAGLGGLGLLLYGRKRRLARA